MLLVSVLLGQWAHATQPSLFNAEGLRVDRYRAPLPDNVPGAMTVDAIELQELISKIELALVGVEAITLRPETADFEVDWLPASVRYHLEGSVWSPQVGYGELTLLISWFIEHEMTALTGGNQSQPVIFYCVADCWMS